MAHGQKKPRRQLNKRALAIHTANSMGAAIGRARHGQNVFPPPGEYMHQELLASAETPAEAQEVSEKTGSPN